MKSQLRVGLIGCGAILQRRHLPEYLAHKDVVIVAVCDPNLERAQEVARQFGIPNAYETHQQLLQSGGIDAVSVFTPNHLHSSVSIEAMELGIHVLVEKPMATSLKEAEVMIRTPKEQNVFLMVGHNQRFMPAHRKEKDILQNATILYCEKGTLKIGTDDRFGVIVEYSDGTRDYHEVGALQTNNAGEQHNSGVIHHFVDGILSGNGDEITGLKGYRALQTILAGLESQHLKKVVVIPELVVIN